ncbi:chromosomal replication initiator DnaA [Yoonia sp. 208BN28-4]|uniref:chromosomal replication initiator DnaA n=1 Tax=Yoonia sp. 208BN28-4 TaxID=3126505 RepID=UPI0030B0823B
MTEHQPRQLAFDFPPGIALGPDDFFVSEANRLAFAMLRTPGDWPEGKLVITGPIGCGKSHLARVFHLQTGARVIAASDLVDGPPPDGPIVVEDMENLPAASETAMFHLHNHQRNIGQPLLMTSALPPARWPATLPDLVSRMQATTVAPIDDPDDALLTVVILKLFSDRQIVPPPNLAPYLAQRIERSFAAAADIVERLDKLAMAEGKDISQRLAAALLDKPVDLE